MKDKDWLDKVWQAYSVYKNNTATTTEVENFIHWLYSQYGIIAPDKK